MAKKRPSKDSEEPNIQIKKVKEAEFNGTGFKAFLREPAKTMFGLETFILKAKQLPCPDLYDVVEGYIKISMECSEIFNLLEGEKHTENEMILIFQSLEMILLRTASDLNHFSMVGTTIVKKTVSTHMKLIQSSLHSGNHRFVRRCLCFLSAMVSQGPDAAREVFRHFQFNKSLNGLVRRRDKMGRPDVRMAFIQFALSFLVSGDNGTIGQLLEMKDFLPDILNSGLKEDRISIVNLILSTLQTRVVQNKAISKTHKVRFFSPSVLSNLASLYRWNGIVDASTGESKEAGNQESGKMVVRQIVHNFLIDLCCSRKHGISFYDPSFGIIGRAGNIVLLQFLVGLKKATEDELVAELVARTLKVSPDILPRYFKESQYSFTPRVKDAWQENMTLLNMIYEAQPEVSKALQTREVIPLSRLLSMVMVTSIPPVCSKAFFTQGLNLANTVVQQTTLSMVSFVLKRAHKNIQYCLDKTVWETSDIYTPAIMDDFVQLYKEALSKILPDMTSIVSKWQSLTKKEKDECEPQKEKKENTSKDKHTQETAGAEAQEIIRLKALILQVMYLYQKVVPHLVTQSKFDFSKLLKGIVSEKGVSEDAPLDLQYQILQLCLHLPTSKFSWFHVQDVVHAEKSVFYLLLKMFANSHNNHLKTCTQMLVLKVLKDTGVFEYTGIELEFWLSHLAQLNLANLETVIQFLERVLVNLVYNPHMYTEKVASLVQEAAYLQANLSGQEGDTVSAPISQIDDVLGMVDVIMESSEVEIEAFEPSLSEDLILLTFPFSALVPAVLEARNKLLIACKVDNEVVCEYVAAVLSDILHCQRDPLPLCLALLQYDEELVVSSEDFPPPHPSIIHLHHYFSRWLPQQFQKQLFKSSDSPSNSSLGPVSFTALMKAQYSQEASAFLDNRFRRTVEDCLSTMDMAAFPVAVKQVLLYIKSTIDNFSKLSKESGAPVLSTLMGVLQDIVSKLLSFHGTTELMAVDGEEGADLLHEVNLATKAKDNIDLTIMAVLRSIFKHPYLEQWFLAVDLASVPPHTLNPGRLKLLCGQLSDDILDLLQISAPYLRKLGRQDLLSRFLSAVCKALLRELGEKGSKAPVKMSRAIRGFLVLHDYMDSSRVVEVVTALLLLPQEGLITFCDKTMPTELSVYGCTALQVLTESTYQPFKDHGLSVAHLQGLGTLLLSCSSPALEAYLLQVLISEPGCAKLMHIEVMQYCLKNPSHSTQTIGSLLLQNCSTHRLIFELWCLEPANMERLSGQMEAFLPLVNTYLLTVCREDPARPKDVQTKVLKALKQSLLAPLCTSVLSEEIRETVVQHVETLASLVKLAAKVKDISNLISNLPAVLQREGSCEWLQLIDAVSDKLTTVSTEEQDSWKKSILSVSLKWLISSFCQRKEKVKVSSAQEDAVLERLAGMLTFADVAAIEWNGFVKTGLKYRYTCPLFLRTLNSFLDVMYGGRDTLTDLLPLVTMHMMISSHSLFLSTMLGSEMDICGDWQAKEALVSLLVTLVKKCPAVCNLNHYVVLLGAYGGTLCISDQKLLLLLQEYEQNNISMIDFQSLLWGPAAVDHHKAKKSLGQSLWQQPSTEDILDLLKAERMLHTITHFPQQRRIIPKEGKEMVYRDDQVKDLESLYDPCFLLPLFSAMLQPESVIDCLKFVSSHALGFVMVSLSSYDSKLRAAAYQVLACFCQHLEGARLKEKKQLLYLMDTVKNGIKQHNLRLPLVLTSYISKAAHQMLKPEDHMYVSVNRFLLCHQSLDLRRVPEFFKLFYSFDMEHKVERKWIISVLEEGLADRYCYELCDQQGIFQTLLGFSSSSLCDEQTLAQILNVLHQAVQVTKAAYNFTKGHGLITWAQQLVERRHLDQCVLSAVIDLIHVVWFTNLGQKESQNMEATAENKPQRHTKCLPLPLINEFLCLFSTVIRHLRGVKAAHLSLLVETLSSVLRHRRTVLKMHEESDWLTLQPQSLSSSAALSLLHCWASMAHDAALLTLLQHVAEKHMMELFETVKDKGCNFLSTRSCAQEGEQMDDAEVEKQKQTILANCKPHLRIIFTYWEPVSPISDLKGSKHPQESDSEHLSCQVSATAHLLIKWSLRSLIEEKCNERGTVDFVQWLQNVAIPNKGIIDALLCDRALKADLLRLYHQMSEHQSLTCSRVEMLKLFTSIMIHLLEACGCPSNNLHQVVLSLTETTHGQFRKEAGLMLLSQYIYEMWSGATSPEMFLLHVKLVAGAEEKGPKKSHSLAQRSVKSICSDISQSLSL
ncbi:nucleolar pre-ribosomal-associated protein 1 isoform X1 [Osmerus eperlanus]|uniref:nucleolar pre-ribosomal-associated protein 1 isoform X1 n=1 Tax=Osmerus eperlanus TaxID=29151 RepID=UPI002E13988B